MVCWGDMKKTFRTDALRNIKKRIVSWLSIATILFIGFSGILGIHFAGYSMEIVGDSYVKEHNFKDFDMTSTLGVQKSEVERIKEEDGILDAEGVISVSGILDALHESINVTILSMTERISVPYCTEGSMPIDADECGIPAETANKLGLTIGDTIKLSVPSKRFAKIINSKEYKIAGFVYHPDYIVTGKDDYVILPVSSFNTEELAIDYTNVFVDVDVPENISSMKNEYYRAVDPVRLRMEELTETLSEERVDDMQKALDEEYENAKNDAFKQLGEGRKQLAESREEFESEIQKAQDELNKGIEELEEGRKKANAEISENQKKLEEGEEEYNTKVADGQAELDKAQKDMEDELAQNKWKLFDGYLQIDKAEQQLKEKEDEYNQAVDRLGTAREQLDNGWAEYNNGLSQIEVVTGDTSLDMMIFDLISIQDGASDPADKARILEIINDINDLRQKDTLDRGYGLLEIYDSLDSGIELAVKNRIDSSMDVEEFRSSLDKLAYAKKELELRSAEYDKGKERLKAAREELDTGWYALEQKKKELYEGEAEYARREPEARKQLEDAKADFEKQKADGAKELEEAKAEFEKGKKSALDKIAEFEKQIEDGRKELEEKTDEGNTKLADAEDEYETKRKEVVEGLSEARKEIEAAKNVESRWSVQTRKANLHFLRLTSSYEVLAAFFLYFSPLYAVIVILVCFFTLAIIVEEQKTQIGVSKAFGLYKSEIRLKYLTFGITAAVIGEITGLVGALGMEKLFHTTQGQDYIFGVLPIKIEILPTIIMAVGSLLLTTIAVVLSCEKLLSGPAVGLINGTFPEKKSLTKASKNSDGSLYAKLIIRNAMTDFGRVVVSITIILLCSFMMGLGFTARNALNSAVDRQISDIWKYDIKVTKVENITKEQEAEIEKVLEGCEYISLYNFGAVIQSEDDQTLAEFYAVDDDDELIDFYAIKDKKGNRVPIPTDGILVTQEMREKNKMTQGTRLTITDSALRIRESDVRGEFVQHFEHGCIMTKEYYRELFDTEEKENTYLVKAENTDLNELAETLESMDGVYGVSFADDVRTENKTILQLYDAIVVVIIMFAILLCFMILLNLSNILVLHRMRELLTMRVNGFSHPQVVGYLAREMIFTTVIGAVLGIISGVPGSAFIVTRLEANAVMFVREPYPFAWVLGTFLCFLFAAGINAIAFRKVGITPLTDINKY